MPIDILRLDAGGEAERAAYARQVRERYYAGERLPCPVGCGGAAEVVRVLSREEGGGDLWLECGSCAQRGCVELPAASDEERVAVEIAFAEGGEAPCPRHARRVLLQRRGRQLACPECGVRFRG